MLRCGGLVYCLVGAWLEVSILWGISIAAHNIIKYFVVFMTVPHTHFYIVVDTQWGCHTLKKKIGTVHVCSVCRLKYCSDITGKCSV